MATSHNMAAITVAGPEKSYKDVQVLQGVDF